MKPTNQTWSICWVVAWLSAAALAWGQDRADGATTDEGSLPESAHAAALGSGHGQDKVPPVLECAADRTVECGEAWSFDAPTATDNSGDENVVVTILNTVTNAGCGDSLVAQRTWQAEDRAGNVSDPCTQTVTVSDTTPPVLTCAPAKTVECGQPWAFDVPVASDACVFNSMIYNNATNDLNNRFEPGPTEVGDEIVLEGTARHLTQFVFEYWGVNNTQPEFAGAVQARVRFYANDGPPFNGYPTPGTLLYDSGAFAVSATARATLIIEDFVLEAAVPLTGPVPDTFTWTVQFGGLEAGDAAGLDLFSPPVVGTSYPDYWERAGEDWMLKTNAAVTVNFAALALASEEPLLLTVLNTVTNAACGATFEAIRTWEATDPCGRTATCSQTVTVVDTTPPTLACAPDKTVECGQPWAFDVPVAGDACVFNSLIYDNATNDLSYCFNPGTTEVGDEIVLEGAARHLTQFVFEYWGVNTTQPEFAGAVQARVRFYANDGPPFNGYPTPGTVLYDSGAFGLGATPRATLIIEDFVFEAAVPLTGPVPDAFTWTVQFSGLEVGDAAGLDIYSPPVVGGSYPDYWERAGGGWLLKTNAAAAVDFAALALASEEPLLLRVANTVTNAACGATLEATRTWEVTDPCNHTATCSQTVTVVDTTPPALVCALDKTVECGQPWAFDAPAASDACGPEVLVGVLDIVTNASPAGTLVAACTWVATDSCGLTATCSQEVTVSDTTPPTLVCPANLTVNCDVALPPADPESVVAADNCVVPPVVTHGGDVESGTLPRVVTRTYRATDGSGNAATCDQTITFRDVASAPPAITEQPRSRTNNVGTLATFTLGAASCEAPTFQWYFNDALLAGETGATLALDSVTLAQAGDYYAVALNTAGASTSQLARLTVNRPPVAAADAFSATTDAALVIPGAALLANDTDADGDLLRVLAVSSPSDQGGTVVLNGTDLTYTPPRLYAGPDFFFYTVADGRGGFDTTQVDVSVASPRVLEPGQLEILNTVDGQYLLRFKGDPSRDYEVRMTRHLNDPIPWETVGTVTTDANGDAQFVVADPPWPMAFFRCRAP
ncbi:MAG: HYR domain-containing protein [Verrucomicrobia bacterium]|nr:HYR domain-containing protein [Verrucomicrobiota bacterium]